MPDTTLSNDLMELLKNGTISQSSFAFIVEDDSWEVKDGVNIRTINKVSKQIQDLYASPEEALASYFNRMTHKQMSHNVASKLLGRPVPPGSRPQDTIQAIVAKAL